MNDHPNYRFDILHRVESKSVRCKNGCIEYRPGELAHSHGLVSITIAGKRKNVPVRRAKYMALHNCFDLPHDIYLRTTCKNARCVNLDHLTEKSQLNLKIQRLSCI